MPSKETLQLRVFQRKSGRISSRSPPAPTPSYREVWRRQGWHGRHAETPRIWCLSARHQHAKNKTLNPYKKGSLSHTSTSRGSHSPPRACARTRAHDCKTRQHRAVVLHALLLGFPGGKAETKKKSATSHVARHTSRVTRHTPHVTRHTPHVTFAAQTHDTSSSSSSSSACSTCKRLQNRKSVPTRTLHTCLSRRYFVADL